MSRYAAPSFVLGKHTVSGIPYVGLRGRMNSYLKTNKKPYESDVKKQIDNNSIMLRDVCDKLLVKFIVSWQYKCGVNND